MKTAKRKIIGKLQVKPKNNWQPPHPPPPENNKTFPAWFENLELVGLRLVEHPNPRPGDLVYIETQNKDGDDIFELVRVQSISINGQSSFISFGDKSIGRGIETSVLRLGVVNV